jgi:predicted HAD superfamily Cof-like phosphohydrolase
MGDEYLKSLNKTLKLSLEEGKKQNLIVDYKILLGNAATPQDFDILVMVESKNMAALDNGREKFDPIARKIVGPTEQQQAIAVKRLDIREIIGTKLMREITLK